MAAAGAWPAGRLPLQVHIMPSTMGIINGLLQNGAATDVGHILDKLCAEILPEWRQLTFEQNTLQQRNAELAKTVEGLQQSMAKLREDVRRSSARPAAAEARHHTADTDKEGGAGSKRFFKALHELDPSARRKRKAKFMGQLLYLCEQFGIPIVPVPGTADTAKDCSLAAYARELRDSPEARERYEAKKARLDFDVPGRPSSEAVEYGDVGEGGSGGGPGTGAGPGVGGVKAVKARGRKKQQGDPGSRADSDVSSVDSRMSAGTEKSTVSAGTAAASCALLTVASASSGATSALAAGGGGAAMPMPITGAAMAMGMPTFSSVGSAGGGGGGSTAHEVGASVGGGMGMSVQRIGAGGGSRPVGASAGQTGAAQGAAVAAAWPGFAQAAIPSSFAGAHASYSAPASRGPSVQGSSDSPVGSPVPASASASGPAAAAQAAGGTRPASVLPFQFGHMSFSVAPQAVGAFPHHMWGPPSTVAPAPIHVGSREGQGHSHSGGHAMLDISPAADDAFDMEEATVSALGRGGRYGSMSGPSGGQVGSGAPSHGRVATAIGTTSGGRHSDDSYHHADGPGFGFDFGLGDEEDVEGDVEREGEGDGQGDARVTY